MVNNVNNNILIPNVTSLPIKAKGTLDNIKKVGSDSDFETFLKAQPKKNDSLDFSKHALKRIEERKMNIDSNEFLKLKSAITKLKAKGGKESLVITSKGAYILDVNKGRVVTAMDKEQLRENVFTKIDSTLFIN